MNGLSGQSSKSALNALIQGFLVTKTTPHVGNTEVWDQARDQNHIARISPQFSDRQALAIAVAKNQIIEILAIPAALK